MPKSLTQKLIPSLFSSLVCLHTQCGNAETKAQTQKLENNVIQSDDAAIKGITLHKLYEQLEKAPDEISAENILVTIEKFWAQSGSPTADLLLIRALTAAENNNFDAAIQFLSSIIELYPNWPEAYNRRAFLYVLRQDYLQAQSDLRTVLSYDSRNIRALEGLVRVLRALGQTQGALEVNRELLKVYPFSQGAKETMFQLEEEVKEKGI